MNKTNSYQQMIRDIHVLTQDVDDAIANYANVAAVLYQSLPDINWAGFYFYNKDRLVLGPFQGKPACVYIPTGKGVCGTAFAEKKTLVVPDVLQFPDHIACDERSRSEIVVPLFDRERPFGVLDIDSPLKNRFDHTDAMYLEQIAGLLSTFIPREM
jgi:L-methionine (R)-S-oxide reductase